MIRRRIWPILGILILTCVVYAGVVSHEFLVNWDDGRYVTQNFDVRGLNFKNIKAAFSNIYVGNYAPLHIVSYMLDYELFGLNAFGYKIHNLLLHLGMGLLFYFFLQRHVSFNWQTSLAATLIFLLHPVQVESVAWISQRKTVLSGFFFLAALFAYGEYRLRDEQKRLCYGLSIGAFVLALLTKSVTVVLLPILLFGNLFLWPQGSRSRAVYLGLLPFVFVGMLCAFATLYTQDPAMGGRGGISSYPGGSLWTTFLTMAPVLARYLMMVLWPLKLSPAYAVEIRTTPDWVFMGSLLLVLALAVLAIWLYRNSKPLFFWYLVIFTALLPVSQIIPIVTLMNDRYLYLPMLGISALAASQGETFLARLPLARVPGFVAALCLAVVMSPLARDQVAVWKNSAALWQHAMTVEPGSVTARVGYASTLVRLGNFREAEPILRSVLEDHPGQREAMVNLAGVLTRKQQYAEAEALAQEVVRAYPYFSQGHEVLGIVRYQTKRKSEAEASFRKVVELENNSIDAKLALGVLLLEKRSLLEAEALLSDAWDKDNSRADLAYALGCLYALQGKTKPAIESLRNAVDLGMPGIASRLAQNPELNSLRRLKEFEELSWRAGRRQGEM